MKTPFTDAYKNASDVDCNGLALPQGEEKAIVSPIPVISKKDGRYSGWDKGIKDKENALPVIQDCEMLKRLSENAHLLRYPRPSSLRRTSMYASFLGTSETLHLGIFHQPLRSRFFDSP